jgi:hypothetical protein
VLLVSLGAALPKSAAPISVTAPLVSRPPDAALPAAGSALLVPLMDIARLDTPLLKRVPTVAAARFATTWARLLDVAVESGSVQGWSDFFIFPKCMLWSPVRGGWRISSKRSQGALVLGRLDRWPDEKARFGRTRWLGLKSVWRRVP